MPATKNSRLSPELLRTILGTVMWVGIGLFVLNTLSGRRILECDRQSGQLQCHLTTKQLLTATSVTEFERGKLQKAIINSQHTRITRGHTTYQATLVTTQGDFWLTPMDSEQFTKKHQIMDDVNTFLENPQVQILTVESSYSSLFWIGSGIFTVILGIFSFGIFFSLRFSHTRENTNT